MHWVRLDMSTLAGFASYAKYLSRARKQEKLVTVTRLSIGRAVSLNNIWVCSFAARYASRPHNSRILIRRVVPSTQAAQQAI